MKSKTSLLRVALLLTTAGAGIAPGAALAADVETATVEDIVVTARRTSERLQDVPVAVSALGANDLAERRIGSETDLQIATPGLTVRQTGSSDQLNYAIRGQSIDAFSFASPAVTTYFNEIQVGGGSSTSFFDFQSIQVLKGPQGTLFGRNATGGAVLYSSTRPGSTFGGYAKAGYGNYDNRELEGALNLPFNESVALRASGKYRKRDGFQTNLLDGSHPNSINSLAGRLSLLIAPQETGFENLLVAQRGRFRNRTGAVKMQNANGVNGAPATYFDPITGTVQPLVTNFRDAYLAGTVSTDPRVNALFSGIGDYLAKAQQSGFYDVYVNSDQKRRGRQTLITNSTSYELGDATLKNIFGYNKVFSHESSDIDGSPYDFLRVGGGSPATLDDGYTFTTKQWSNELQLSGTAGALKYIVGAFYSKEKNGSRIPLRVTGDLGAPFLGPYDFTVTDKSTALYAQMTYAIVQDLNLTGGLRYTWEDVSILQAADSLLVAVNAGRHSRKDKKPSWLAGIDYKIADGLLLYFNHRGSWRTGGFNGTSGASFPDASTFKPETTYDFELGAKFAGRLAGMRTRFNLAIFDQYIRNVQRAPYLNISALAGNVNKARVSGFETDGSIDVTGFLQLGGALTYTDARYTDPRATVAGASFFFGPYGDAPKWSGSAWFRLSHDLDGDLGELALRGEFFGQTGFHYSNLANTIIPNTRIAGYRLLNARAEWNDIAATGVSASLYVSNLTDKKYHVGGFPLGAVTGSNGTLPGTPRTYGIEMSVKF